MYAYNIDHDAADAEVEFFTFVGSLKENNPWKQELAVLTTAPDGFGEKASCKDPATSAFGSLPARLVDSTGKIFYGIMKRLLFNASE